jgi:hypothetical protein
MPVPSRRPLRLHAILGGSESDLLGGYLKFRVSHEVLFVTEIDAANQKEAEAAAEEIPYEQWGSAVVTREDVIPIEESPINPHAGG